MKKRYFALVLLGGLALSACDFSISKIDVTAVDLIQSEVTLEISESETLTARVMPENATDKKVVWTIGDSNIASISSNGLVTGLSIGETVATVTTHDGGFTDTCDIIVSVPVDPDVVSSVELDQHSAIIEIDEQINLTATVLPATALNKTVQWSSSNDDVASISNTGLITGIDVGNVTITVTTVDGGFYDSCQVRVNQKQEPSNFWDTTQDSLRYGTKDLDFYSMNDFHGAVEFNDEAYEPGINKLSTYLKNAKADNPEGFVLTSSGDMWQGSADSNITRGRLVTDWLNVLDVSAMALGNHEFDWTIDVIKSNMASSEFPLLACNIIEDSTQQPVDWVEPYTTITKNGVHIGIIGAIGEGITSDILSSNVEGLSFANPEPYVISWADYLRDNGADIVLYLLHDSVTDISTLEGNAVDAIFGGHTHKGENTLEDDPGMPYNTPAVQAWSNGKDVGHIFLRYDFANEEVVSDSYSPNAEVLDTRSFQLSSLIDDPETASMYQEYLDNEISAIKNEVRLEDGPGIAKGSIPNIYNQYAYRYFKDFKDTTNSTDIFMVQTNNARAAIPAGDITYGDIYKALPFDNSLYLATVKGSDITGTLYNYGTFYLPSQNSNISGSNLDDYVVASQTYNILIIDFIAQKEYFCDVINVVEMYTEENALPRNIVSRYIPGYPGNVNL